MDSTTANRIVAYALICVIVLFVAVPLIWPGVSVKTEHLLILAGIVGTLLGFRPPAGGE